VKLFCDANAVLLSNFMREIIYEALDQYKVFFDRFLVRPVREVKDIIEGERLNPLYHDFEDTFLTVKLRETENKSAYSDNPKLIKENLLRILDELVKVSQQISRPENTLRKSDKPFLPEVTF
jgi:predicted PilT family ATPase